jgi:hypothetical protein
MAISHPSALPMVLLPPGQAGEDCLETAKLWASFGLLRRSLWIPSDQVQRVEHAFPYATGWLLEGKNNKQTPVDHVRTFTKHGRRCLVVLSTPGHSAENSGELSRLSDSAELLMDLLDDMSPETLDGSPVAPSSHSFHLVAAPIGMAGVSPSELIEERARFTATLVVSPEDRRAADQSSLIVRGGKDQAAWAVAHAATVAGIWTGLREDFWGGFAESESSAQEVVHPVRCYVRVVSSSAAIRRALQNAMAEVADGESNSLECSKVARATDPTPIITKCLKGFDTVDSGRIAYSTSQTFTDLDRATTGGNAAVEGFFTFARQTLGEIPKAYRDRWKARMSRSLTKSLSGDEGNEVVTVGGIGPEVNRFRETFERTAVTVDRQLDEIDVVAEATPDLWKVVRETTLGLLDGSPIPSEIADPFSGAQPMVLDSPMLAVPPPEPWRPSPQVVSAIPDAVSKNELVVPGCSPRDAARVREVLLEAESKLRSEWLGLRGMLAESAQPTISADADPDSAENSDEDGSEQPTEDHDRDGSRSGKGKSGKGRSAAGSSYDEILAEKAETKLEVIRQALEDLSEWVSVRTPGLMWRLAQVLDARIQAANRDKETFRKEATSVPAIDYGEIRRAHNSYVTRFSWINIIAIILGVLLWQFGPDLEDALGGIPQWVFWVVLIILFLFLHVQALFAYRRRRSRFGYRLRLLLQQQQDAIRRAEESARAASRLNGLYGQLMEWAEFLGYLVHRPWSVDESVQDPDLGALQDSLPACLDVAVPDPADEKGADSLRKEAHKSIAECGWRSSLYQRALDHYLSELSDADDDNRRIFDDDSPANPNGSRRKILAVLRDGTFQRVVGEDIKQAQSRKLYELAGELRSHHVRPIHEVTHGGGFGSLMETDWDSHSSPNWGEWLDAVCEGQTQFTRQLWTDDGLADQKARANIHTCIWHRGDLPSGAPREKFTQLEVAAPSENNGDEVVSRIDVGPAVSFDELRSCLRLFSGAPVGGDVVSRPTVDVGYRQVPDGAAGQSSGPSSAGDQSGSAAEGNGAPATDDATSFPDDGQQVHPDAESTDYGPDDFI